MSAPKPNRHDLKTAGLTKRRNTVLATFVREYEQFDNALEQKEREKNSFQQKFEKLQAEYDDAVEYIDEKVVKIGELNTKVIGLQQSIDAKKQEIAGLKVSVHNKLQSAISAEKKNNEERINEMREKCTKQRKNQRQVLHYLQRQLTTAQRYLESDSSDDDENSTSTVNSDELEQNLVVGGDNNAVTVSSSDDEEVSQKNANESREAANQKFVCTEAGCQRKYKSKSALSKHLRVHQDTKPFPCDFAGCCQAFIQKADLNRHKLKHTGAKPFTCNICRKTFTQVGNLNTHLKTHLK